MPGGWGVKTRFMGAWVKRGAVLLATIMIVSCAARTGLAPASMSLGAAGQMGHGLQDAFMRDPPACVVVLPMISPKRPEPPTRDVEAAVERFLTTRIEVVLSGASRNRLARHLALNLERPEDLGIFAAQSNCRHAISVAIGGGGLSYAVIWAERRLDIDLRLFRIGERVNPLWSARGTGTRGDGGPPLSPLGIVGAMIRAARVAGDRDLGLSLLDDVLRRMMKSLPDVRGLAYSRAYPPRLSMNSTVMPSGSRK
jgi:hypothetical protein